MDKVEYHDDLVEIGATQVRVKNYYLNGTDKLVSVPDIEWVRAKRASIFNGKLRFSGTGNFHAWFANDLSRPTRDTIFVMKLRRKWWQVGFTVENSARVRETLGKLGVLKEG
jgi:hypothetical protein